MLSSGGRFLAAALCHVVIVGLAQCAEATLEGHTQSVWGLTFSPDGKLLFSQGATVKVWDAETWKLKASLPHGAAESQSLVTAMALTADGTLLAICHSIGRREYAISFWDIDSCKLHEGKTIALERHGADRLAFSPDGNLLAASIPMTASVRVFNYPQREQVAELREQTTAKTPVANCIKFSPDGSVLAMGCWNGNLSLWDRQTWKIRKTISDQDPVKSVTFSPDGTSLVYGSLRGELVFCDVANAMVLYTAPQLGFISQLARSPDGKFIAVVGSLPSAYVWDTDAKEWNIVPVGGTGRRCTAITFAPDGKMLALASYTSGNAVVELYRVSAITPLKRKRGKHSRSHAATL